jgi:hypothetical protein
MTTKLHTALIRQLITRLDKLQTKPDIHDKNLSDSKSRKIGSLHDPSGHLSMFASDQSFRGHWDIFTDSNEPENEYPWFVQRVESDKIEGQRYQFADTLAQIESFFLVHEMESVTISKIERFPSDSNRWWIYGDLNQDDRDIYFEHRVYANLFDKHALLNALSIHYRSGNTEPYTKNEQRN